LGLACRALEGEADEEGSGEDQEDGRNERSGVEDGVVGGGVGSCGGSVAEEEIILDAHAGDGGHGDLDPSLLVCGRNDVEGGKGQAEEGSGCGAES